MFLVVTLLFNVTCDETFFLFSACEVSFDNVPVPLENVIGEIGGGFKVSFILSSTQAIVQDYICIVI